MLLSTAVFYVVIPTGLSETIIVFLSIIVSYGFFNIEEFAYSAEPVLKNYYVAGRTLTMLICWAIVVLISLKTGIKKET